MIIKTNGFGTEPAEGQPIHGPTMLPTWWIGQVPMAIPVDGWEAMELKVAEIIKQELTAKTAL